MVIGRGAPKKKAEKNEVAEAGAASRPRRPRGDMRGLASRFSSSWVLA
jgi:hypothetical protein